MKTFACPVTSIAEIKERIAGLELPGVNRLILFGSFARGEQIDESDVDFLIEYEPGTESTYFTNMGIEENLANALLREVDIVQLSSCRPWIREGILESPREVVYERRSEIAS